MNLAIQSISLVTLIATSVPFAASASPNLVVQRHSTQFELQQDQGPKQPVSRPFGGSSVLVQPCPEGQKRVMWDKPIYDKQGKFVVGYEKVPICVPDDLEPAG